MLDVNPTQFPDKMGHFFVQGQAGNLEVLTELPKNPEKMGIGIVCHPNPLQEGNMTNKVVYTVAKAFERSGLATVRFNYRGVGQSEGSFGDTAGEVDDLLAIMQWVKTVEPHLPIWLAGFSFGAYIAAQGANQYRVEQLISVAPAVHLHPYDQVENLTCPWLIVQGDQDDVVSPQDVATFYEHVNAKPDSRINLVTMEGVGHFFHGRLTELRDIVEKAMIAA